MSDLERLAQMVRDAGIATEWIPHEGNVEGLMREVLLDVQDMREQHAADTEGFAQCVADLKAAEKRIEAFEAAALVTAPLLDIERLQRRNAELETEIKRLTDAAISHLDASPPWKPLRLAGRCSSGAEADGGRLYHAVPVTEVGMPSERAYCGATYGRLSAGWSSNAGGTVTCRRCRARLDRMQAWAGRVGS